MSKARDETKSDKIVNRRSKEQITRRRGQISQLSKGKINTQNMKRGINDR